MPQRTLAAAALALCATVAALPTAPAVAAPAGAAPYMATYDVTYHAVGVHDQVDRYEYKDTGNSFHSVGAWTIDEVIRDVSFIGHQPAGNGVASDIEVAANARFDIRQWEPEHGLRVTTCTGDQPLDPIGGAAIHGPQPTTAGVPVEWVPVAQLQVPMACQGFDPDPRGMDFHHADVLTANYLIPLESIGAPSFEIKIKSKPDQCARPNTDTVSCRDSWSGTVTYTRTKLEKLGEDPQEEQQGGGGEQPTPPPPPAPPAPPPVVTPPGGGVVVLGGGPKEPAPVPCTPTDRRPCIEPDRDAAVAVTCAAKCRGTVKAYGLGTGKPLATKRFARRAKGTSVVRLRLPRGTRRLVVQTTPRGGRARTRTLTVT